MSALQAMFTKVPLTFKVVSLYVPVALILCSVWLFAPQKPASVASTTTVRSVVQAPVKRSISGQPVKLTAARLGIDLTVKDGTYVKDTGGWALSDDAIHFAIMTKQPNNTSGNTFIYGHNTEAVLAPLRDLIPGDIVTVTTSNGHVFSYAYTNDTIVPPNLTDVLRDNPKTPRLTIMTCDGIWSQGRRLMYFDFKEVM